MTILQLRELDQYSFESLYTYLKKGKRKSFRIVISMEHLHDDRDYFMWYGEYYYAFYLLEELGRMGQLILYRAPKLFSDKHFKFMVYDPPVRLMAKLLIKASGYFGSSGDNDEYLDEFIDAAARFWKRVGDQEIEDPICSPHLDFFNALGEKAME